VLVQTPPLPDAPKYIPPFCVVDEDAGLETASIRRNVCRTKDADGVRKTPEITLTGVAEWSVAGILYESCT